MDKREEHCADTNEEEKRSAKVGSRQRACATLKTPLLLVRWKRELAVIDVLEIVLDVQSFSSLVHRSRSVRLGARVGGLIIGLAMERAAMLIFVRTGLSEWISHSADQTAR